MVIEEMENVRPNKKPHEYDAWRMYESIGTNIAIYLEKHSFQHQPYIIIIDVISGKRIKITFQEEGKENDK